MKIAVVSANTESHKSIRSDLIQSFLQRGHEVVAFGGESEEEWAPIFAERGHAYRQFFVNRTGTNPLQDLRTIASLKKLYFEEKPDKVFTYHAKGNIYGAMAASKVGISEVYSLVAGLGSIFRGDPSKFNLVRKIMGFEYRYAMRGAKTVFFQNEDDRGLFVKERIVDSSKTMIINGSGVDLEKFPFEPFDGNVGFLFVGRLIRDKGIAEFIEAARLVAERYPDVSFNVVGGIDDNPTSLTKAEVQLINREGIVRFYGSRPDVLRFYQENAVFVLPSYHEGTPRSALEALSVGRPVILTDAPGCREVVKDAENGFMVPVRDSHALAEAMIKFVENPALVRSMGEKSRAIAEAKYDVHKVNEVICSTMGL